MPANREADGGGIRGLSELIIIEELMERVREQEKLDETPIPAEYFDLIGGASTGGLIALLLARLRLSAAEAIAAYEDIAGSVFSKKKNIWQDGTFKASLLEQAVQRLVEKCLGKGRGSSALMFEDDVPESCRAFVCAVAASDVTHGAGPTLFRTYEVAKNREYNCAIWEAARATSAAPTFFKRISIGPPASAVEYVDAGLGCNNPVKQVVAEAARVFGGTSRVDCIVSVGTGQAGSTGFSKPDAFQKWLPIDLIKVVAKMATDSGKTAEELNQQYKDIPDIYHRFDVDRGLSEVSLEEWKRLGEVRAHTKNYLKLANIDNQLETVVAALTGSPSHHGCEARHLAGSIPSATHVMYSNVPAKRVSHFVLRAHLQSQLDEHVLRESLPSRIIILLGMGGSGKTQLALAYCHKLAESGRFVAILWVDASSPVSVVQSYENIAKTISKTWRKEAASNAATRTFVKDSLRAWRHRWLIVFDNYDNPAAFQDESIHHYIPEGKTGTILFTSRHTGSARLGNHVICVSGMEEGECLQLLLLRPPPYTDHEIEEGGKIGQTLGYLPLAIDQAGAYIRARNLDLKDFNKHYGDRKEKVLNETPDLWEYCKRCGDAEGETKLSVFTTWELSFEQLSGTRNDAETKTHLLSFAAFLDNETISEKYFRSHFDISRPQWMDRFSTGIEWGPHEFVDVLAELLKLSLIQTLDHETGEAQFSLHPLIRDWVKLRLPQKDRKEFTLESIAAMTLYLQSVQDKALLLRARQETVSHLNSCCQNDFEFLNQEEGSGLKSLPESASTFAKFYESQGLYKESKTLYLRALSSKERTLGSEHEAVLETMLSLATLYRRSGEYEEAKSMSTKVFRRGANVLGSRHPLTLASMHELAEIMRHKGQYDLAEEMHRCCFSGRETILGPMHPDTLASAQNLAEVLRRRGQYQAAETMQRRVLEGYKETLGPTHPSVFMGYHNLGAIMRDHGQYAEAEELQRQAMNGRREVLGLEHPDTLNSFNNLGLVLRDRGKYDEAEKMHRRALTGREKALGPAHPQTLTSSHNLARVIQDQGRYGEAQVMQKRALDGYETVLGPTHPYTLTSVHNLALLLQSQGDYKTAEGLYRRVLSGRENVLGLDHLDTLTSVKSLADISALLKRYTEAIALYQRCYDSWRLVLSPNHPSIEECERGLNAMREKLNMSLGEG
ncbi:MAG: hypothetical protein M1830_009474 [Pleopsidium flavum]|nr:MAG: hypothetical protein M1830_009474 [Pleopsidium flavum]